MTKKECIQILRLAFAGMSKAEAGNLAFHLKRKTKILCGEQADCYCVDNGL